MHSKYYFIKAQEVIKDLDFNKVEELTSQILKIRENKGRIFFIGVGGSAGNCSHAVNDFRKLCGIKCYSPSDNVSELTARINDEGWDSSYLEWLKISNLSDRDCIFVFSVGGGNIEKNVSMNIVKAVEFAKYKKSKIFGVVGRDGGYTKLIGDCVITVPTVDEKLVTPLSESFQTLIWHCLVSHPNLQIKNTKW